MSHSQLGCRRYHRNPPGRRGRSRSQAQSRCIRAEEVFYEAFRQPRGHPRPAEDF